MTEELDIRPLRERLGEATRQVRERMKDLSEELERLHTNPPPGVLKIETGIVAEFNALELRLSRLNDRWLMLTAYEYQRRHGFPILHEAEETTDAQ